MLSEFARRVRDRYKSGFARLMKRINLWVTKAHSAYNLGQMYKPTPIGEKEQNYKWELGNTEQHCKDCLRLDGVILSSSGWQSAGIMPQSPDLECGGWNCDCRLVPTDEPILGMDV